MLGTTIQNLVPHDLCIPDLQLCITGHVMGQPIWYVWSEFIFNIILMLLQRQQRQHEHVPQDEVEKQEIQQGEVAL
jgi:hypothetical protein